MTDGSAMGHATGSRMASIRAAVHARLPRRVQESRLVTFGLSIGVVGEIERGTLDPDLDAPTDDEIGDLDRSVDAMRATLQTRVAALETQREETTAAKAESDRLAEFTTHGTGGTPDADSAAVWTEPLPAEPPVRADGNGV